MMRKVLLVCALVALVAGSACADHFWNASTGTDAGANARATLFGHRSAGTVKTGYSATPSLDQGYMCVVEYTGEPRLGGNFVKTGLFTAYRAVPDPVKWILAGFTETSFPTNQGCNVLIWGSTILPATPYDLYLLYNAATVPVAGLAPGAWGRAKLNTTGIIGTTAGSAAAPWFKYSIPRVATGSPLGEGTTYVFEFMPVPEPGSMIAVLSGLIGLVGFGIRRRK